MPSQMTRRSQHFVIHTGESCTDKVSCYLALEMIGSHQHTKESCQIPKFRSERERDTHTETERERGRDRERERKREREITQI